MRPLRRTEVGRIALPLWVLKDGQPVGDGDLVLTYEDARRLCAELAHVLEAEGGER